MEILFLMLDTWGLIAIGIIYTMNKRIKELECQNRK